MDCWVELGIAEDSDKKKIKVAFLKLTKIINAESDPQGYADLNRAYEEALSIVGVKRDLAKPCDKKSLETRIIAPSPPIKKTAEVKLKKTNHINHVETDRGDDGYYNFSPQQQYFVRRFLAFLIDFLVVIFILNTRSAGESTLPTFGYILTYLFFIIPLMEASPLKGSVGKLFMGIRVVDSSNEQLGIFQSFKRTFSTAFMVGLIKFRIWELLAQLINNNELPQDNSSHSKVVAISYKKVFLRLSKITHKYLRT